MLHYKENNGVIQLKSVPSFQFQLSVGETIDSVQHFVYVLDCVSMLFQQQIPQIGQKSLTIVNYPHPNHPICYREQQLILLNTSRSAWSQIAFQFAHELCHYAIPNKVDSNLRWFEESICEVASLYFLRQIGYYWLDTKVPFTTSDGAPYAASFLGYAKDRQSNIVPFDLRDASTIRELEHDCYNRSRNNYVASRLLPIFTQHPEVWTAVPLLCKIHEPSLGQALDAWILESAPSVHPALLRIRNLF